MSLSMGQGVNSGRFFVYVPAFLLLSLSLWWGGDKKGFLLCPIVWLLDWALLESPLEKKKKTLFWGGFLYESR